MKQRKIAAIITSVTGDRVVVGLEELAHAKELHFVNVPNELLLELIEKILKDPDQIYEEKKTHNFWLFYKLDESRFLVVVVKRTRDGIFFSTLYPTGKKIRNKHSNLKKVKL